jgi:hypothetical protein
MFPDPKILKVKKLRMFTANGITEGMQSFVNAVDNFIIKLLEVGPFSYKG